MNILSRKGARAGQCVIKSPAAREKHGRQSGIIGIFVNIALFLSKGAVGLIFGSVSILADAINNLSDVASSVIILISFKLSAKPADKEHPFGHARAEYIAASYVGAAILFICFELAKSSVKKIINPAPTQFSALVLWVLAFSILAKIFLYRFNLHYSKKIDSTALRATAVDSLSDVLATGAVLLSAILSHFLKIELDGYMGVLVAGFIMFSAIKIMRETADCILGRAPSSELTALIAGFIQKYEGVLGMHDLSVHEYGPHRIFASVHVEVDEESGVLQSHALIDEIEKTILRELGINLVIHLDPVMGKSEYVKGLQDSARKAAALVHGGMAVENFRVVKGSDVNTLIFDVSAPKALKISDGELIKKLEGELLKLAGPVDTVISLHREN